MYKSTAVCLLCCGCGCGRHLHVYIVLSSYNGVDLHEFDKANLLGHEGVINDLGIKADFWGSCINGCVICYQFQCTANVGVLTWCSHLLLLASCSMVENAQRFLSGGQDPNAPNKRHIPALHLACANNRRAIVKLLLDHGANMYLCVWCECVRACVHVWLCLWLWKGRRLLCVSSQHAACAEVTSTSDRRCTMRPTQGTPRS